MSIISLSDFQFGLVDVTAEHISAVDWNVHSNGSRVYVYLVGGQTLISRTFSNYNDAINAVTKINALRKNSLK